MEGAAARRRSRSGLVVGLLSGAGALVVAGAAVLALTTFAARLVVTPPRKRDEDIRIRASTISTITLSATPDTRTAGRYGLWFSGDSGHARVGEKLSETASTVTRELIAVDFGDLRTAKRGRFSGWFYLSPAEFGFPFEDVDIPTPVGAAPAWLVPAARSPDDGFAGNWAIHAHGRGVTRAECLRGVPVFRNAGFTSLLISYRNDGVAPDSADRRYGLGGTEWRDLEAAIEFAVEHGATGIVLVGWSMGGATVLQASMLSRHRQFLRGLVLESPVVDWVRVLHFQATAMRLPYGIRRAVLAVLGSARGGLLTGQSERLDFTSLNMVERAHELDLPTLLLHSAQDGYVPVDPSRALAALRPDLITFEEFTQARHARLWNYDRSRWESAIADWLAGLSASKATSGHTAR